MAVAGLDGPQRLGPPGLDHPLGGLDRVVAPSIEGTRASKDPEIGASSGIASIVPDPISSPTPMPSPHSGSAGSIQALFRHPVKSMRGEALTLARVLADHGVQGDRAFAVLDVETGRVASAKHPRRWGALLGYEARFVDALADRQRHGPVSITLPDGATVRSDHADAERRLSIALGREVRLSATPPPQATYDEHKPELEQSRGEPLAVGAGTGTFFDYAPIHLVTSATLSRFQELAPASRLDVARFRPNLVIDTGPAHGFVETAWLGQVLAIGDEVRLCVTFPCPRCVMTTLAQGELPADPAILRTAAAHNKQLFALLAKRLPTVGAYATVIHGGTIRLGDPVRLEGRAPLRRAAAFVRSVGRAVWRR
jgi:hypothetical protein